MDTRSHVDGYKISIMFFFFAFCCNIIQIPTDVYHLKWPKNETRIQLIFVRYKKIKLGPGLLSKIHVKFPVLPANQAQSVQKPVH